MGLIIAKRRQLRMRTGLRMRIEVRLRLQLRMEIEARMGIDRNCTWESHGKREFFPAPTHYIYMRIHARCTRAVCVLASAENIFTKWVDNAAGMAQSIHAVDFGGPFKPQTGEHENGNP